MKSSKRKHPKSMRKRLEKSIILKRFGRRIDLVCVLAFYVSICIFE
jgi:hypothetical protein